MLFKTIFSSIKKRKTQFLFLALVVFFGTAVVSSFTHLDVGVKENIAEQMRAFGPNIVVRPKYENLPLEFAGINLSPPAKFLREGEIEKIKKIFWRNNILNLAPFLSITCRLGEENIFVVGTWFGRELTVDGEVFTFGVGKIFPWWKVEGNYPEGKQALVGEKLAKEFALKKGDRITLTRTGPGGRKSEEFIISGTLETGGLMEDRMFAPLDEVQRLSGKEGKITQIMISALTRPEDPFARRNPKTMTEEEYERWYCTPYPQSIAYQIEQVISGSEATPIEKISGPEGKVLGQISSLMFVLSVVATIAASLGIMSSMTASVLERQREIGLMRALGGSKSIIYILLLGEAILAGLLGSSCGYFAGVMISRLMSRMVFDSSISWNWQIFPMIILLGLGVTLLGGIFPAREAIKIEPVKTMHQGM